MFLSENIELDMIFLLHKKDKMNRILMNYKLEKNNIDPCSIEIVDGDLKEIIKIVKKKDYKKILILQDDIIFHKNFYELLKNYNKELFIENDVIYLGCNRKNLSDNILQEIKEKNYYNISSKEEDIIYGYSSVILNRKIIDILDTNLDINLDTEKILIWNTIKKNNLKGIVLDKNLVIQINDIDNEREKELNYNYYFITKNFKTINNDIINNKISLRNIDSKKDNNITNITNITNIEISKLIEKNNKSFVFIVPSYNNERWYKWNLDSIFNQVYPFWRIIYIDDASTDNTGELVKDYVKLKGFENKFKLIKKKENTKQAHSRLLAYKECQDDEICCMVDGDDALVEDKMLLYKLNKFYIDNNLLISYGLFYIKENDKDNDKSMQIAGKFIYSKEDIDLNKYRHKWITQHLRTCEASLLKQIPEEYMKYKGEWLKCCTDVAEMWWVLEKSNGRHKNFGIPAYYYNKESSINSKYSYYNKNSKENKKESIYRQEVLNYLMQYKQV